MKNFRVVDCLNEEHYLIAEFIYKLTTAPTFDKSKTVVTIHLNHKNDNYTFGDVKTYESVSSLLSRLQAHNITLPKP